MYNRWYHREYLHKAFQGHFYALPNEIPHGPTANARPLLNFTTIWKVFSTCLKQCLTPLLCAAHVIPPSQIALHGGASAIDTLPVIHDHILDRWFADLLVCMVFDDVRHDFGSVQHDTLEAILRMLHFPPHLISILMNAATGATLHMGRKNGMTKALAKFRAGIAQGCPMSALLFCILLELRIRMVLHDIPKPQPKFGDFGHVAYMDDTTYLLDQVTYIQQLLSNVYQTRIMTPLRTSTVKLLVAATHRQGLQVIDDRPDILAGGSTTPMVDGKMYIRLLGRHTMPHVFHTNDFIKMMHASHRASIVLRYVKLPANYPILMYNASAGGAHR